MTKNLKLKIKNSQNDEDLLVVSQFFVEVEDWRERYKSLRKTIKNLKKFNETQLKSPVAEA